MAATVHTTIRLDTDLTGILPTNEYRVAREGYEELFEPAVLVERSFNATLHVHRVLDGSVPQVFEDYRMPILITSIAQKEQLAADLGKNVYFMPHYRDESDVSYRTIMHFLSMEEVHPYENVLLGYWRAVVVLKEATGATEVG